MKENQGELDKEMTGAQPGPEIDVEAVEDLDISEAEAEKFGTAELKAELEEVGDEYLRARTGAANMANQGKDERGQLQKYRSQDLAKELFPLIDSLEHALTTGVSDDQGADLKKGMEMVLENLCNTLEEEGVEEVPARGEASDPDLRWVVQAVPATEDTPADTIVEVLQEGCRLHDHMLRPTMVIVTQ